MTASNSSTKQAAPREPRAARRSRTTGGAQALLKIAAERTGDAPETVPAMTAPAAVALPERLPESEWTWHPTIGHVVDAKFDRWYAARPKTLPAPVRDEDLPPPPPLPQSPQPVGLTPADGEFLAKLDAGISTTQRDIERGHEQAVADIREIHRRYQPPVPADTAETRTMSLAEVAQGVERGELRLTLGEPEENHETSPHPWLDTLERELAPDSPAPEPPPPAEDHEQVSDDTGTWLQTLPWTSDVDSEAPSGGAA